MKMLKLFDFEDYEKLPITKWKIKQPNPDDERENPMKTGMICYKYFYYFMSNFQLHRHCVRYDYHSWCGI